MNKTSELMFEFHLSQPVAILFVCPAYVKLVIYTVFFYMIFMNKENKALWDCGVVYKG